MSKAKKNSAYLIQYCHGEDVVERRSWWLHIWKPPFDARTVSPARWHMNLANYDRIIGVRAIRILGWEFCRICIAPGLSWAFPYE